MKAEWHDYLIDIGVEGAFLARAKAVLDFFGQVYPNEIEDVFVSEYCDKEGKRHYESMWLFSKQSTMEAKRFLQQDDFDSTPLERQVKYWTIRKTDFDFRKASAASRLHLEILFWSDARGDLKASGDNCAILKKVFLKHIVPNAVRCSTDGRQSGAADEE